MTSYEWGIVSLTAFSVLLVPVLVILVRGAIKWTKVEDKLSTLVDEVRRLMSDKDRTHAEMLEQMRTDREATDRRLRFIEEFWMHQGRNFMSPPQP